MKILVVDDDEVTRASVKLHLENPALRGASGASTEVTSVGTVTEARACIDKEIFDLAFVDIRLGPYHRNGGIELLKHIRQERPTTVVIMMTSVEDDETVEKCLLAGAADYIFKPFDYQGIHLVMIKARATHRLFRKQQTLKAQAGDNAVTPIYLASKSPLFQKVIDQAKRIKGTDLSVLLLGETGVGKEVLARYLWTLEADDSRPFVAVHSGGLSKELVESELFGHIKGSFTGATENKIGKFQYAHRGDFFLDEIATMPPETQLKLLRVLQEKKVTPVGSNESISVDCRIICATNENLEILSKKGIFREDLYFRIKRAVLMIPPLRHRKEDLPDLIDYFLQKYSLGEKRLTQRAFRLCMDYNWPGNIRQLEGAIETTAKMQEGAEITEEDLSTQIFSQSESWEVSPQAPAISQASLPFGLESKAIQRNYKRLLRDFEQTMVRMALKEAGSENAAAEYLGLPRSTLVSRRKSWGWCDPEDFKTQPLS